MTGLIFGVRNWDMACNDNGARGLVAVGQGVKAVQGCSELGSKGATKVVNYLNNGSWIGKTGNFLAKYVNPVIVGASAVKIATADDKEKALCTVAPGIGAMFAGEKAFKTLVKTAPAQNILSKIAAVGGKGSKMGKILAVAAEGAAFATASILSYMAGSKTGEYALNKEREIKAQNKLNTLA